jgi:hypothetical protein
VPRWQVGHLVKLFIADCIWNSADLVQQRLVRKRVYCSPQNSTMCKIMAADYIWQRYWVICSSIQSAITATAIHFPRGSLHNLWQVAFNYSYSRRFHVHSAIYIHGSNFSIWAVICRTIWFHRKLNPNIKLLTPYHSHYKNGWMSKSPWSKALGLATRFFPETISWITFHFISTLQPFDSYSVI